MSKPFAWSFSRLKNFETCPKRYYKLQVSKEIVEPETEQLRYGGEVHKALELRVRDGKPLPLHLRHLEKVAAQFSNATGVKYVEQKLAITKQFEPTGWFDADVWCRAILDLAIVNETHAIAVDWKTGKMKDDFTQMKLAGVILMLHMQELETIDLLYYWIRDKKPTRDRIARGDIKEIITELLPRVRRLQIAHRDTEFPAKPSYLCKKYCPVTTCPHHGE